ncbi:proteasome assembly chaperone 3-like [Haliotis cracherodii]|uniref:proteasome assembly chaperone 3-like n=1 Tax=Haliotis rufescens TaxID=6454 RepID=UPI001EAFE3C6|nr:proteasome assembly chaperone 3-like [Haliotis rufescens]
MIVKIKMAAPMSAAFPVMTKQVTKVVNDNHTDVLCSRFDDRLLLVVSQLQKFGTMVQISRNIVLDEMQQSTSVYSTKVLLGSDEPLTHVLAKNLIAEVKTTKPIILTMSLKDTTPQTVKALAALVKEVVS